MVKMRAWNISLIKEVEFLRYHGKPIEERITEIKIEKSSPLTEEDFEYFNKLREADDYLILQNLNLIPSGIMIKYA